MIPYWIVDSQSGLVKILSSQKTQTIRDLILLGEFQMEIATEYYSHSGNRVDSTICFRKTPLTILLSLFESPNFRIRRLACHLFCEWAFLYLYAKAILVRAMQLPRRYRLISIFQHIFPGHTQERAILMTVVSAE